MYGNTEFGIFVNQQLMKCSMDLVWVDLLSITKWKCIYQKKCHGCHTLNALQINFTSYSIDLEYLWQTER